MKRRIPLLLVLAMLITGCTGAQTPTNPRETIPAAAETVPETTAPNPGITTPVTEPPVPERTEHTEQTSQPTEEPEIPPTIRETTAPTEPAEFIPYTIRVEDPERLIYAEPGFHQEVTACFEEAGVYTIVEERYDQDGNLWGRLKSGIGWVCLTEPPITPIHADFAPEHFVSNYQWHCGEAEYVTDIGILANEHITDLQIALLGIDPPYNVEEVLYTLDEMEADQALKLSVVFWGDFTTYGVSFTDSNGIRRSYALMISGKDGSLVCSEYQA